MFGALSQSIIGIIQQAGYFGVFIFMTLESALIPIPSEVTMPFAGFMVQQGMMNFWIVVLVGAIGNLVGSLIAYAIGFYLEEHIILSLIKKYGKYLLLSKKEYMHSVHWFQKYGNSIAFFSRLLPGVRTFISLPAGLAEMNIIRFAIYSFLGSFIWSAFLTWVGLYLGSNWHTIDVVFHKFHTVIIIAGIGVIAWFLWTKLKHLKKEKEEDIKTAETTVTDKKE